ncbi:methylcobamide:CoM methyltransferase MtaA [Methanolobus sp. ZRKC3]|uniref:methylcobamide:CoM methyltransferase MtaA n=1 Tax=Methanolobus sp. ZRKC3 TaxID=3125786 RepID=UPI00324B2FED
MAEITLRDRFIRAIKMKRTDKVPVCSVTQTGTIDLMKMTGAYWPEAHFNAEKMAALAIAGHEIAGFEAVRYPFDITSPLPLDVLIEGTVESQPSIVRFPCKVKEDLKTIDIEHMMDNKRIETILNATEIIRDKVGDDVPLVAGAPGPASIAYALAGPNNYLEWMITDEDIFKEMLSIGVELSLEYSNAILDHGADAICMPESGAGPDLMPPQLFESMVLPEYKNLTRRSKGLLILHMCGDAVWILDPMSRSGFEGISIEERVDVEHAKRVMGDKVCLIGNVSSAGTLLWKSVDDVRAEAKKCIADGVDILAPSCGVAPRTPLDNLKALVSSRDEYYLKN